MVRAWQRAVAELLGTLTLVFIGAGSVVVASTTIVELRGGSLVAVALAHGIVLAVMIAAAGHASGGHFNPAVTISAWVTGAITTALGALYVVAQLAGAILGAALLRWVAPASAWRRAALGTPVVNHAAGVTTGRGVVLEAILTFFLVFTVYGTAFDGRARTGRIAWLATGLILTVDMLVGAPLTGAAVNPARALGPELVGATWADWWVYWVGPVTGGVIAAGVYWFTFLAGRGRPEERTGSRPVRGNEEQGDVDGA